MIIYPFLSVFLILRFITAGLDEIQIKWKYHSASLYINIIQYYYILHKKSNPTTAVCILYLLFFKSYGLCTVMYRQQPRRRKEILY